MDKQFKIGSRRTPVFRDSVVFWIFLCMTQPHVYKNIVFSFTFCTRFFLSVLLNVMHIAMLRSVVSIFSRHIFTFCLHCFSFASLYVALHQNDLWVGLCSITNPSLSKSHLFPKRRIKCLFNFQWQMISFSLSHLTEQIISFSPTISYQYL